MTMHTDNYPTGVFRTIRRTVPAVDGKLAEALDRPPQAHVIVEEEEMMDSYWESNATSGDSRRWVRRSQRREMLDGRKLPK